MVSQKAPRAATSTRVQLEFFRLIAFFRIQLWQSAVVSVEAAQAAEAALMHSSVEVVNGACEHTSLSMTTWSGREQSAERPLVQALQEAARMGQVADENRLR
jgi:hypothetical protein